MKLRILFLLLNLCMACSLQAQDVIFANLEQLREMKGDAVSTLQYEKRSMNQIYLFGGADYLVSAVDNKQLSKYLKSRSYAVQIGDSLFVNCRKMRYNHYRFGNWYAYAIRAKGSVFYVAQPVGQMAREGIRSTGVSKLPGAVGDAIDASNLNSERVVYELNLFNGRSLFVGSERMQELLESRPDLLDSYNAENSERANVVMKYLKQL